MTSFLKSAEVVLKAASYSRMTRDAISDIDFAGDKVPDRMYVDAGGSTIEVNNDGKWLWAEASGTFKPKWGTGIASLKKFVNKPRKSDHSFYVYTLREVTKMLNSGYVDAHLFLPNDGRVVRVTKKNFDRIKKLFNHTSKNGRA